jgi:Aldehyde dehydrogenase family
MPEHLLYIDGAWRGGGAGTAEAVSPASGETFATVAVADPADVDDAVRAAADAWPAWAGASAFERAGWCEQVVAGIGRRREELARALTLDQASRWPPRPSTRSTSWPSTSGWRARTPSAGRVAGRRRSRPGAGSSSSGCRSA